MSTFAVTSAALAGLFIVMGLILYGVLAASFRIVGGYQAAIAVRRCMMCAQKAQCDEWSGAKRGMESFCPNADFIARAAGSR